MKAEKKSALERARENVAARHIQTYHKHAILDGEWDNGNLVLDELARIRQEGKEAAHDAD